MPSDLNPNRSTRIWLWRSLNICNTDSEVRGHTPYMRILRKSLRPAVDKDVMRKDPCHGISITIDNGSLKKDVLSMDEIKQLITCHYQGESVNIQWAFLFCLRCGLRFCNVKDLTYSNVDFANQLLKFEQAKTKDHSSTSSVVIPLSDGVLELIGKPSVESNRDELIFPLPSYTMCLKALRHWSKRTGIDKHIIWHCLRHYPNSFPLKTNDLQRIVSW